MMNSEDNKRKAKSDIETQDGRIRELTILKQHLNEQLQEVENNIGTAKSRIIVLQNILQGMNAI
jgi:hypothetical protein